MSRVDAVAGALKSVVEVIVSVPKEVQVTTKTSSDVAGREVTSFEIDVHRSDRGRLIGQGGANIRSLRVLLNSAAYLWGKRYRVSCSEASDKNPGVETHEFMNRGDA